MKIPNYLEVDTFSDKETMKRLQHFFSKDCNNHTIHYSWLDGSVVERRSLTGELSLVCTGPAADGYTIYMGKPSAVGQPTRPTQPFILTGSINE